MPDEKLLERQKLRAKNTRTDAKLALPLVLAQLLFKRNFLEL